MEKSVFLHEMLNRLLVRGRPSLTRALTPTLRLQCWQQWRLRRCQWRQWW